MALVVLLAKVLQSIRKSRAVVFLRIYMILLLIRGILIFLINQLGNIHYWRSISIDLMICISWNFFNAMHDFLGELAIYWALLVLTPIFLLNTHLRNKSTSYFTACSKLLILRLWSNKFTKFVIFLQSKWEMFSPSAYNFIFFN
jgi:hypothetical protein